MQFISRDASEVAEAADPHQHALTREERPVGQLDESGHQRGRAHGRPYFGQRREQGRQPREGDHRESGTEARRRHVYRVWGG